MAQDGAEQPDFRVYTHDDVVGVELGGALKNVMAVATGIVDGLGLGYNARAALITRGLAEMTRLGVALGARASDVRRSRRRRRPRADVHGRAQPQPYVGLEIGRGATLEQVLAGKETVAEGVVDRAARRRSPNGRASRCRSSKWCTAFCSTAAGARAPSELMTRGLRAEQD